MKPRPHPLPRNQYADEQRLPGPNGTALLVKRTRGWYWVRLEGQPDRRRRGNAAETRADIAYFLETGALPAAKPGWH